METASEKGALQRKALRASNQAGILLMGLFALFALLKWRHVVTSDGRNPNDALATMAAALLAMAAYIRADVLRARADGRNVPPRTEFVLRNSAIGIGGGIMLGMFPPLYLIGFPVLIAVAYGILRVAYRIRAPKKG